MDDERVTFDLNASLRLYHDRPGPDKPNAILCADADPELLEAEENPGLLTNTQITQILDPIVDSLADSPDAILRCSVLDNLQFLLKSLPLLPLTNTHCHDSVLIRV